jgi:hypothetical protein
MKLAVTSLIFHHQTQRPLPVLVIAGLAIGLLTVGPAPNSRAATNLSTTQQCQEELKDSALFRSLPQSLQRLLQGHSEILKLLQENRLQEAVWLAQIKGHSELSRALLLHLEESLSTTPVDKIFGNPYEGESESYDIYLDNGLHGFFKPTAEHWQNRKKAVHGWVTNVYAEVDTYQFAKLLLLPIVPVTVEREIKGMWGSLQAFVIRDQSAPTSSSFLAMKLLDYLINNRDRHLLNYFTLFEHIVAIDHGVAFLPESSDRGSSPPWLLHQFYYDEDLAPTFNVMMQPDFDQRLRSLLQGRHSEMVITEIIERKNKLIHFLFADQKPPTAPSPL